MGAKDEALKEKLQGESGAAFNSSYLKSQLPAHREALVLFRTEAATGKDPDLVAFAKQTVPVIEDSHLDGSTRDCQIRLIRQHVDEVEPGPIDLLFALSGV